MQRGSVRYGIYVAIAIVILALSGIFTSFEQREVITKGIRLSTVFLIAMLAGTAYYAGARASGTGEVIVNGVAGSLIVGAALAALVVVEANLDMRFVFPNLTNVKGGGLTLGQTEVRAAVLSLVATSVVLGVVGALLLLIPARVRQMLVISLSLTVTIGLLEVQIQNIIALPDALALALAFSLGYGAALRFKPERLLARVLIGLVPGTALGVVLALLATSGGLESGGLLRGANMLPLILSQSSVVVVVVFALAGVTGTLVTRSARTIHNGAVFFVVTLVILGMLNAQNAMTVAAALITFALLALTIWFVPPIGEMSDTQFAGLSRSEQRSMQRIIALIAMGVLLAAPPFMGQYITNVLNLVGLYIIMGIGLNIVVGYAGLLDLGYVAFFAIGAYTIGLLTTPSLVTCGGVAPANITPENVRQICTGVLTFWQAWPIAIMVTAFSGVLLGIPVLRLRGDYLAIVTLGFGEIIRIIVKFDDFKPLFGAAQGIANIPRPVIDLTALNPAWRFEFTTEASMYYLIIAGIVLTMLIATRLAGSRLGRAWRAMRADEDVAQAMGINLTQTKLSAFAIGAAFAGMGGAVAGTRLYGAYPDSFTLLVSINVLCLIIIGGIGALPGVVVGSLMLIGLPEVLRELQDYRLLAFGVLLVVAMLLKPQGLIPPVPPRLSEVAAERHAKEGARS